MGENAHAQPMKKTVNGTDRRKGLTSVVEEYIDAMQISEDELDRIVKLADEIYTSIKKNGGQKDAEGLALTMFIMASVENQKVDVDPYEFIGYA